jgi:hypothetical protein
MPGGRAALGNTMEEESKTEVRFAPSSPSHPLSPLLLPMQHEDGVMHGIFLVGPTLPEVPPIHSAD